MTENELARAIFGKKDGDGATQRVTVISGTAVEDSADGSVKVDLGGEVVSPGIVVDEDTGEVVVAPPQQAVEVPTTGGVKAGDTVTVIVDGGIPTGASGTGSVDRVADVAEGASTAAQEAKAVAEATGQHFWHSDSGAHVTEATREDYETQASGFQNLMTSIGNLFTRAVEGVEYLLRSDTASGMVVYDGECAPDAADLADHAVASFTADGVQIGKSGASHASVSSSGLDVIDGGGAQYGHFGDMRGAGGTFTVEMPTEAAPVYTETYALPYVAAVDQSTGTPVSMTVTQYGTVLPYGTRYTYQASPSPRLVFSPALETMGGLQVTYESDDDRGKTFAFGVGAEATGAGAAAIGTDAKAQASGSLALGLGTIAASENQRVAGRYNLVDETGTYADIIGCGTSGDPNDRANLYELRWDGTALYKNNGTPYCRDGSSIKCAGQTIGSADNLSYVASTDTFRAPALVTGYTGVTGVSVHANSRVYRSGHFIYVSLIFQVSSSAPSAAGSNWITGLPHANGTHFFAGADRQYHAVRMTLTGGGNLSIDMAKPSDDWYTINGFYLAAD